MSVEYRKSIDDAGAAGKVAADHRWWCRRGHVCRRFDRHARLCLRQLRYEQGPR